MSELFVRTYLPELGDLNRDLPFHNFRCFLFRRNMVKEEREKRRSTTDGGKKEGKKGKEGKDSATTAAAAAAVTVAEKGGKKDDKKKPSTNRLDEGGCGIGGGLSLPCGHFYGLLLRLWLQFK